MRATPAHPCCCRAARAFARCAPRHAAAARAACPLLTGGAAFVDRRGSARAWPAHKDHGPQGPHRRCRQEKGLDERHHYLRRGRGEGVSRRAGERCRVRTHASTAMRSFQPSAISHAACYASERGIPSLVVCDLVGLCILSFSESNTVSRQTRRSGWRCTRTPRAGNSESHRHCSLIEWSEIAVSKTRNRAGHRRTTFTTCLSSAARVDGLARRARARCSFHRGRGRAR